MQASTVCRMDEFFIMVMVIGGLELGLLKICQPENRVVQTAKFFMTLDQNAKIIKNLRLLINPAMLIAIVADF